MPSEADDEVVRTFADQLFLSSGARVVENYTAKSLALALVNCVGVAFRKGLNLALAELSEANVDSLVIGEVGVDVGNGSIALGCGGDAGVCGPDDRKGGNILRAATGDVDVVPRNGGEESFQHGGSGPQTGEIDVLNLFWVTHKKHLVVLRDEIDVCYGQSECFFDDDEGPFLLLEKTEA